MKNLIALSLLLKPCPGVLERVSLVNMYLWRRLSPVLALLLACHVQAATRSSFLPSIFPSASGVTKPQRVRPNL